MLYSLQLFPDVLLLAAEPQGSPIVRVPALRAGKGPWGSARHPGPRRDLVRQHGRVLHGAWGCRGPWSHWRAVPSLPEGPGLCDHSGGPPPQPLRPLSPTRNQPCPLRLPGESRHASVILHGHTASTTVLPLHSQPHPSSNPECRAAGGQGSLQENALAVMVSLSQNDKTSHCQSAPSFHPSQRTRSSLFALTVRNRMCPRTYFAQIHSYTHTHTQRHSKKVKDCGIFPLSDPLSSKMSTFPSECKM